MFNKSKFAQILKNINSTYDSQRDFARISEINRTYLSQYMNMKLEEPPKPKILERLAIASHNVTTYSELMEICGYTDSSLLELESLKEMYSQLENNFLDILSSMKLSKDEAEVYNDLCMIVDIDSLNGLSENEIHQKLTPYFNNMEYLSATSKEKVEKKLSFFIQYCLQTNNLRNKVISKRNSVLNLNENQNVVSNNFYMCPVYGQISAGQPNWAEECIEGRLPIDPNMMNIVNPEKCFFLRVNGESMNKVVKNGGYALIRKQDYAEDGDIVVAIVNGDNEATLKKFKRFNEQFVSFEPMSSDESIKPINVDLKNTNVIILGIYIGKFEINK